MFLRFPTPEPHTRSEDRPLIVQFCANDPDTFAAAVRKLDPATCDAVDLNLGYLPHSL